VKSPIIRRILADAAALISLKGFTKHVAASTKSGTEVDPTNPAAAKFCALGAIYRAGADAGASSYQIDEARAELRRVVGDVAIWNDGPATTEDDVVRTLIQVADNGV
jgi:hypothetical protein